MCRFLLPAASLANVGMTINARALEHALRKMLSHPLAEVRQLGEEIKQVAQAEVPTLVKYADAVEYLSDSPDQPGSEAARISIHRLNSPRLVQVWCIPSQRAKYAPWRRPYSATAI